MDKRIRPFEDIAPLNVRNMFILVHKKECKLNFNSRLSQLEGVYNRPSIPSNMILLISDLEDASLYSDKNL